MKNFRSYNFFYGDTVSTSKPRIMLKAGAFLCALLFILQSRAYDQTPEISSFPIIIDGDSTSQQSEHQFTILSTYSDQSKLVSTLRNVNQLLLDKNIIISQEDVPVKRGEVLSGDYTMMLFIILSINYFLTLLMVIFFYHKKVKLHKSLNRKSPARAEDMNDWEAIYVKRENVVPEEPTKSSSAEQLVPDSSNANEKNEVEIKRFLDEMNHYSFVVDDDIRDFHTTFDKLFPGFMAYISQAHPGLTTSEELILLLNFLEIKSKKQSEMLGINMGSLRTARYRLKKKLKFEKEMNIMEYSKFLFDNFQAEQ